MRVKPKTGPRSRQEAEDKVKVKVQLLLKLSFMKVARFSFSV